MDNQLTVADIKNIQSLLEAACSRGTWKAAEMTTVGNIYDKVTAFLRSAEVQLATQQQQPPKGE
jgi:hypothetical protein|nr:hypothetical protein [Oxalobacteraceae bacterium]